MSIIDATSASKAHVETAIASATYGDTIRVPAGSETWASAVSITKGITLQGGYGGTTTITCTGGDFLDYNADPTTITNDHLLALTGFTVDGNETSGTMIDLVNSSGSAAVRVKIGENTFRDHTGHVVETDGQFRGVIYSNIFDRCNVLLKVLGGNDLSEWDTFNHSDSVFGSIDNLYFEDNTVQYSSAATRNDPAWIGVGQSGRIVVRYNSYDLANSSNNTELWDIHGFQYWTPTGSTGTMNVEYYGNIIVNVNSMERWIHHRAYKALFFNNRISGTGGPDIDLSQYADSCYADTGTDYSEIEGSYFWNNWLNGSLVNATVAQNNCGTLTENSRFWNYASSFDGSVGIGVGASAPTGSCTTGVGYWVTSHSPAATPPTTLADMRTYCQAGSFYKATATDTWAAFYSPYTYPHPLRGTPEPTTSKMVMVFS